MADPSEREPSGGEAGDPNMSDPITSQRVTSHQVTSHQVTSGRVTIVNELGLHARAAAKLVQLASRYPVEIEIGRPDMMVNSKSIMGVLMLAACRGTELQVTCSGGADACEEAMAAIRALVQDRFGEDR